MPGICLNLRSYERNDTQQNLDFDLTSFFFLPKNVADKFDFNFIAGPAADYGGK